MSDYGTLVGLVAASVMLAVVIAYEIGVRRRRSVMVTKSHPNVVRQRATVAKPTEAPASAHPPQAAAQRDEQSNRDSEQGAVPDRERAIARALQDESTRADALRQLAEEERRREQREAAARRARESAAERAEAEADLRAQEAELRAREEQRERGEAERERLEDEARAREEAEREKAAIRAREAEIRAERERQRRIEAEQRAIEEAARQAEEARLRAEAEVRELEEARRREAEEAARRAEQERLRAEAEQRAREEAAHREREEAARRAEEARLRAEAEQREREERERRAREEAERRAEEARQRAERARQAADERRRQVMACTPQLTLTAGGSNREYVTIIINTSGDSVPLNAELALLAPQWAETPSPATFHDRRQDGLFEEHWPRQSRGEGRLSWGRYRDSQGREFACPDEEPSANSVWVVVTYDREVGPPASTWQRFEALGAGPLWYISHPVGEAVLITQRDGELDALEAEAKTYEAKAQAA